MRKGERDPFSFEKLLSNSYFFLGGKDFCITASPNSYYMQVKKRKKCFLFTFVKKLLKIIWVQKKINGRGKVSIFSWPIWLFIVYQCLQVYSSLDFGSLSTIFLIHLLTNSLLEREFLLSRFQRIFLILRLISPKTNLHW